MCLTTATGVSYNGNVRHTTTGSACVSWGDAGVPIKQETLFPQSARWTPTCRNPGETQSRPWCYTRSDATTYGQCDIPVCGAAATPTYKYWAVNDTHDFQDMSTVEECFVWNNFFDGHTNDGSWSGAKTPFRVSGVPSKEQVCRKGQTYVATIACWEYGRHGEHIIILGIADCVSCGDPPPVNNAYVINFTSHYQGGQARYDCLSGFTRVSGSRRSKCQRGGTWTVSRLNCSIDCGQPPPVDNTTTTLTGTTENQVAVYTCAAGFVSLAGDTHSIICLSNGSWKLPDINCTAQQVLVSPTSIQSVNPTLTQSVNPTPTQSVNPTPTQSVNPTSIQSVNPTPTQSVNPTPTQSVNPTSIQSVNPTPTQSVNPTPTQSVNPTTSQSIDPTSSQSELRSSMSATTASKPLSSAPLYTTSATTATHTTSTAAVTVDKYGRTRRMTCVCRCVDFRRRNLTLEQRLADLHVGVERGTLYIRRLEKTSAADHRVSSMSVGLMGILLMVFMFGAMLIPDMLSLVRGGLNRSD
ncbi:uncharacterized protein LOC124280512 isoform X4 [Haliotis rubra]|uniref:uncharacterized protein LOC124280512 isoform X4 n=1 Tax=Haliotis rubra TaxID=36100 RepID=UPI001EE5B8AB|nr:uncharacterized protein LOC124280512 isoform X4 [Haliotis rubra]